MQAELEDITWERYRASGLVHAIDHDLMGTPACLCGIAYAESDWTVESERGNWHDREGRNTPGVCAACRLAVAEIERWAAEKRTRYGEPLESPTR